MIVAGKHSVKSIISQVKGTANQLIIPFKPTLAINRSINKQIPRTKVVVSK